LYSLILAALGLSLGHLDQETVGLITLVGLITISVSTYLILYSHPIYEWIAPYLSIFERKVPYRENAFGKDNNQEPADIIMFGLGRFGMVMADTLQKKQHHVLGIDFNPEFVKKMAEYNINTRYGDAEDPEFLLSLPLNQSRWVVATIRDKHTNLALIKTLKNEGYEGRIAVAAKNRQEAVFYEQQGVDLVLIPYEDAALEAAEKISTTN